MFRALFASVLMGGAIGLLSHSSISNAAADTQIGLTFPMLKADDLNGRKVELPKDFPGDPTLVFIAFKQQQQFEVYAWIDALALSERPEIAWVELPTINRGYRIAKGWIDSGMRSGIVSFEDRARTITIYGQSKLMNPLQIEATDQILTMVVDRDGKVIESVVGEPNSKTVAQILTALEVSD